MNQMTINFEPAARASDPATSHQAARKRKGQAFSPEEVTLGAMDKGIVFADLRAWGGVFAQAAREGYIRRSEQLFPCTMSNGSLRPGWVGV